MQRLHTHGFFLFFVVLVFGVTAEISAQDSMDGVWASDAYGFVFVVENSSLSALYDVSSVHCVDAVVPIPLEDLTPTLEGDQLVVRDAFTVYITAHRLTELPAVCQSSQSTSEPETNFEAFWNTFNEHYVNFDIFGVDWAAQYKEYRPQITPTTTPAELWDILCAMIQPLKDGHVSLTDGEQSCSPDTLPPWAGDGSTVIFTLLQALKVISGTYLDGDVHIDFSSGQLAGDEALIAGELTFYGRLSESVAPGMNIGYVNIISMVPESETGIEGTLAAIDRVVADLADVDALIIDIRFNGGGFDGVSLALASRFADQQRVAFSKQARIPTTSGELAFTPLREFMIAPDGTQQYTGNIVLLTSGITVSAAETFTLAMDTLPYVTQIGEVTMGSYSDILPRTLPNGWTYGLSNERYYASDGVNYEGAGDPPTVEVLLDVVAYQTNHDTMLDAAIEYIGQQP